MGQFMRTSQIKFEQDNKGVGTHTTSRDHFPDPGVVFGRSEPPYKNASVVPLKWNKKNGKADYVSETIEQFQGAFYINPRMAGDTESRICFGTDSVDFQTQSQRTHHKITDPQPQYPRVIKVIN